GPGAGGVHPGDATPAPFRPDEEVLDVDLHDLLEPGEERVAEPFAESAGAVPEADDALGAGSPSAAVRGWAGASGCSVPEALPAADRGADGGGAAGASQAGVPPARAGGQELRGDRGDHGRESGHGEGPAAPGAHELCRADRAAA